jgi:ATP-dependent protease ClpP protease subunit
MLTPKALELWNKVRKAAPSLVNARGSAADINLYGIVGQDFTDQSVADALDQVKDCKNVTIYVNSPGGNYFQGKAIYSQIARFAQAHNVTMVVDAIAGSAASFILMASPRIEMSPSSTMMIHEVHADGFGRARDLHAQANLVEAENGQLADIYAKRTGKDKECVASMMDAETWMTAREAVDQHFADAIAGGGLQNERDVILNELRSKALRAFTKGSRPAGARQK